MNLFYDQKLLKINKFTRRKFSKSGCSSKDMYRLKDVFLYIGSQFSAWLF